MPLVPAESVRSFVTSIFSAAGCGAAEARTIARRLVDANLTGHDSHGVIRIPIYLGRIPTGRVRCNQHISVVADAGAVAILDGNAGFGQVIGEEAMQFGIAKAAALGAAVITLRNVHHLGRIADWAEVCATQGYASIHFVNIVDSSRGVAPFGGIDRKTGTNPFCCAIPVDGGEPIILDMATSAVAEGKIWVARNKGLPIPAGWLVAPDGGDTTDPNAYQASPPAALLPFGLHKGGGLSWFCELFAGALSGGGCNLGQSTGRVQNNMLSIIMRVAAFAAPDQVNRELTGFMAWMKSARPRQKGGEILSPGEPERRLRKQRLEQGLPIDDTTWNGLLESAAKVGVAPPELKTF
jgi:uncharacterized oxidoreductase